MLLNVSDIFSGNRRHANRLPFAKKKPEGGLILAKDMLDLVLEKCQIKRLLHKTTDPLELKERPHLLPRSGKHDHGRSPDPGLLLKVLVMIKADLSQVGQTVLTLRDKDIEKHAVGLPLFRFAESLGPVGGGQDLVTMALEPLLDNATNILFIINDQNTFFIF